MRISQKEMRGLIGPVEAVHTSIWFVAEHYRLFRGLIYPDGHYARRTMPLSDPDLFLSFARLGAHGDPLERSVLSWISEHGLLTLKDSDRWVSAKDETINQAPMTLGQFRTEVRKAYDALTILQQIRGKDCDALRDRIERERTSLGSLPPNHTWTTIDGRFTLDRLADGDLLDEDVLSLAVTALEFDVEQEINDFGIKLVFAENDDHPRPLSPRGGYDFTSYRPQLTVRCSNLGSALWYQFGALISDKRPLLNCENCGLPFVARRHAKTCSTACRKAKSRRTQEHEGDG
jgi:hypothetical protein